jgi:hypothetical protein
LSVTLPEPGSPPAADRRDAAFVFISTAMDRRGMTRSYGPGVALILMAVLIHLFAPLDPTNGARFLEYGILALVCLLSGGLWIVLSRLNWSHRQRLQITPDSISLFKGTSLLAIQDVHGEFLSEILAAEILEIKGVRLTGPLAYILRWKSGLEVWAADIVLKDRRVRLSDLAWQPDINTLGGLNEVRSELGYRTGVFTGKQAIPGPLMALRAAGYAVTID